MKPLGNSRTRTALLLVCFSVAPAVLGAPLGTAFTYQGRLKQPGQPYQGTATLVFELYDAPSGGTAPGSGMNNWARALTVYNGELIAGGSFTTAGGQPSYYWARWGCPFKKRDLNCDGKLDAFDIDPFVDLLTGG